VKAGVAFYGRLVGQSSANTPKSPVDIAAQLQAPVLGLYGADDQGIPQDTVEKMRAALLDGGKRGEIVVYPKTEHGFFADYRPSYNKENAADAWKRMQAWFKKYGAA
jgi:carboxymethylenebutenolidase